MPLVGKEGCAESCLAESRDKTFLPVDLSKVRGSGRTEHERYAFVGGVDRCQHIVESNNFGSGTEPGGSVPVVSIEPPVGSPGGFADNQYVDFGLLGLSCRGSAIVEVSGTFSILLGGFPTFDGKAGVVESIDRVEVVEASLLRGLAVCRVIERGSAAEHEHG